MADQIIELNPDHMLDFTPMIYDFVTCVSKDGKMATLIGQAVQLKVEDHNDVVFEIGKMYQVKVPLP